MIDTSQWRTRIGHWNHRCSSCSRVSSNSTSTDSLIAAAIGTILVRSLAIILVIVLMLSGDIELNPGPGLPPQLEDVFRCLKTHSHLWEDIGRDLGVPKDFRVELQQQGLQRTNKSKLEDVLYRWIESKCSEVSWDHLMEVLRDELDMAATADEIKEYLLNHPKAREKYGWTDASALSEKDDMPEVPDSVLNGTDGVIYNGTCGWRMCSYRDLHAWRLRDPIGQPSKRRKMSLPDVEPSDSHQQSPSGLPTLQGHIHCIKDITDAECCNYSVICHGSSNKPEALRELLSSLHETKNTEQCQALASSLIDKDICMGRIEGFLQYSLPYQHRYVFLNFLKFLRQSGIDTWNTIHLYPPDDPPSDKPFVKPVDTTPIDNTICCKKVRISCVRGLISGLLLRSETIVKCIDLFSQDKLLEFECNFMELDFFPNYYRVFIRVLELPQITKILLKGEFRQWCWEDPKPQKGKNIVEQWTKDNEQLKEAIASASSLKLLVLLRLDKPSYSRSGRYCPECEITKAILQGVAKNKTMTSLIMKNFIYREAGPALEQLLEDNTKLQRLWLLGEHYYQLLHNLSEINTSMIDLNIFLPKDYLDSILKMKNLKSLAIAHRRYYLYLPFITESAEVSNTSLLKCCLNLTRLRTSHDLVLEEFEKQSTDLEQILLPEELEIDKISYCVSKRCRPLKYLEVFGDEWPTTLPYSPEKNNYSRIFSLHGNIEVLKIPVSCLEVAELIDVLKKELKNLQTLELRISLHVSPGTSAATYESTGYDVTAGIFSVVNTVLQHFPKLKQLQVVNANLQYDYCMEVDIKGDHVLDEFTSAVVSHSSIEYIGIKLNQVYDKHSWINDVLCAILSKWPKERRHQIPTVESYRERVPLWQYNITLLKYYVKMCTKV